MKNFEDLTEQEILNLSHDDVEKYVNLKKANEGIKLIEAPEIPKYKDIPGKDMVVYVCGLFGDSLLFKDLSELQNILEIIRNSKNIGSSSSRHGSDNSFFSGLTNEYSFDCWDEIKTKKYYSPELYKKIKDDKKNNDSMKQKYESYYKDYEINQKESNWISKYLFDKYYEVQDKYNTLNSYCNQMKETYMSLAEDKEEIAIKFLVKAHSLNNEEKKYVLTNYK